MTDIAEFMGEVVRLTRAFERTGALLSPIGTLADAVAELAKIAPEVEPETNKLFDTLRRALDDVKYIHEVLDQKFQIALESAR